MAAASNAEQTTSANANGSGVPSPPMAMPAVRDTNHTTITAKFTRIVAWTARRVGPSSSSAARTTWTHATMPKKRPWVHDTPACSPMAAKWMPAAPSISSAIDQRITHPMVMVRLGVDGAGSAPAGRGSSGSCVTC